MNFVPGHQHHRHQHQRHSTKGGGCLRICQIIYSTSTPQSRVAGDYSTAQNTLTTNWWQAETRERGKGETKDPLYWHSVNNCNPLLHLNHHQSGCNVLRRCTDESREGLISRRSGGGSGLEWFCLEFRKYNFSSNNSGESNISGWLTVLVPG